ncbi:hypothetical protein PH562_25840, partial [Rhizobium sp. CNPSo 4062]|uniref:hypothetical protein n=1 Tax=Rhizobium sp. CNPSo 4062 TaxID=3021410 RepID=UPI00254E236C
PIRRRLITNLYLSIKALNHQCFHTSTNIRAQVSHSSQQLPASLSVRYDRLRPNFGTDFQHGARPKHARPHATSITANLGKYFLHTSLSLANLQSPGAPLPDIVDQGTRLSGFDGHKLDR